MKRFILLNLLIFMVTVSKVSAQENNLEAGSIQISSFSDYSIGKTENKGEIMTLKGNVALKVDHLDLSKADKVVIDKTSWKLTVYGHYDFIFKGKIVYFTNSLTDNAGLEYIIGTDLLRVK
jgi:lipopolysaccharide assembly outer membrane protein LptD (OstA)